MRRLVDCLTVISHTTRHVFAVVILLITSNAAAQSLPSGFASSDIGAVGAAGSATGSSTSFTVTGAGADIWNTADAFRFAYVPLTGDGSIVAQVTSVEPVHAWTKAGVMMRASLGAGSQHAMMIVSAGKGLAFQRRVAANGISTHTAGGSGTAPEFVRMVRSGNQFTASHSHDGVNWTVVGSETINMPATIYMGFAVGSHVYGNLATATFGSWSVTGNTQPVVGERTLVFFRHGEKPAGGYGQITCQGLRRALALPPVLINRFGTPDALFAPNPSPRIGDPAGSFHYVRPLATIEPTAIRLGMPVNAEYGWNEIAGLQTELLSPAYASSLVFISWEHAKLVEVVQDIMDAFDSGVTVPAWTSGDYDSFYIVRLTPGAGGQITAQFERDVQGLNNLPTQCP
ncbi:MAG: hypothetical protein AB7P99_12225 [Vicinamibacterales bacterium]